MKKTDKKVACIIPAYNEEKYISPVIEAVLNASLVDKVYVVDDGSSDKTSEVAQRAGAYVIKRKVNGGKGAAMESGISKVDAYIYVFIDADLIGLKPSHIDDLVRPLLDGKTKVMTMGKFIGGRVSTHLSQAIAPGITGQRAMSRELAKMLPPLSRFGFAVEVAINDFATRNGYRILYIPLKGAAQHLKEEKRGFLIGFLHRLRMYYDIIRFHVTKIKILVL